MPSGVYKRKNNPVINLKGGWKGKKRPPFSETHRKNIGLSFMGRHPVKEFKKGKLNPNWKGGMIKFYPDDWKNCLRDKIRERDNFICQECGIHQSELVGWNKKLDIHHIDYNKDNCELSNLISLCRECHMKTNHNRSNWLKYFLACIPKKQ